MSRASLPPQTSSVAATTPEDDREASLEGAPLQARRLLRSARDGGSAPASPEAPAAEAAPATITGAALRKKLHRSPGNSTSTAPPAGLADPQAIAAATATTVVGNAVADQGAGQSVLSKLSQGQPDALRGVGVGGDLPFVANSTEWGLGEWQAAAPAGQAPSAPKYCVVKGGAGAVNWDEVPDLKGVGHTHPARDINPWERLNKDWGGAAGDGTMTIDSIVANTTNRAKLLPSTSDFHYTFDNDVEKHMVHSPYQIDPTTKQVYNPNNTHNIVIQQGQPLAFLIEKAKMRKVADGYEGELVALAGGSEVWRKSFSCIAAYVGFPPDIK